MSRKTVMVTGASRGIGRAIALFFAKEGYDIIITCSKDREALTQTSEQIQALGVKCLEFVGDMGDYSKVEELYNLVKKDFIMPDIVINNAGIASIGLFQYMSIDDWNKIIATNVTSIFNTCHFFLPSMINERYGRIVNISSVWGNVGASCEVAYSATKGAVNSLTKALAKEVAPSNIQVNAVACGAIDTAMNSFMTDEDREALELEIPLGRMGMPSEVAKFVFSIATSPEYLTGQIITFDGGWT